MGHCPRQQWWCLIQRWLRPGSNSSLNSSPENSKVSLLVPAIGSPRSTQISGLCADEKWQPAAVMDDIQLIEPEWAYCQLDSPTMCTALCSCKLEHMTCTQDFSQSRFARLLATAETLHQADLDLGSRKDMKIAR